SDVATSTYSFARGASELCFAHLAWGAMGRMGRRARRFSHRRRRESGGAPTWHLPDQLCLSHDRASALFDTVQRARFVSHGAVYLWRGLSQLSPRISARLSER